MKQKYLHKWGILVMVSLLNMVAPLSTDMYMPALPIIASDFGVTSTVVDATLYVFTIFSGVGTLLLSPISDKFGRKKVLIASILIYSLGSLFCVTAPNIEVMILCRILQAIGGGGMCAVAVAIIKDCFEGKTRGLALSVVSSMFVIAPILAPIIGAWLLNFTTWGAIFVVQVILSLCMLIFAVLYQESIPENEVHTGNIIHSYRKIFVVGKNKAFTSLLLIGSFYLAPFMAYLALATFIYQSTFSLSATEFSIFFAINGLFSVLGPLICIYLNNKGHKSLIQTAYLSVGVICTIAVFVFGHISPICILLCIIPFNITTSFQRPFSTDILLDQHQGDTGSASALINFGYTVIGGFGMIVGSAPWGDYVYALGITMAIFISLSFTIWIFVSRSKSINIKGM